MSKVTDAIAKREAKMASRKKAEKAKPKPAEKAEG
jgi:hypothetical protein